MRKVHGSRRNIYHVDRRPIVHDDDDKIALGNKPINQNSAHLKHRRTQQSLLERQNDQKLETTDRSIVTGPNSKFNKYLPKLSPQTYKPSAALSASKDKIKHDIEKNRGRTGEADEEYTEFTYEDDDYEDYSHETFLHNTKQYNAKPITEKTPLNGREKGFYPRNINRQN